MNHQVTREILWNDATRDTAVKVNVIREIRGCIHYSFCVGCPGLLHQRGDRILQRRDRRGGRIFNFLDSLLGMTEVL